MGITRNHWMVKHGHSFAGKRTSTYRSWNMMTQRCHNPNYSNFHLYGGRGIKVCDRWRDSFANFLADMGTKPTPKHSIDRIDNSQGYEPGNCRWATQSEQTGNTSRAIRLTWNGKTQCARAWARELGLTRGAMQYRIKAGWTMERIVNTPLRQPQ